MCLHGRCQCGVLDILGSRSFYSLERLFLVPLSFAIGSLRSLLSAVHVAEMFFLPSLKNHFFDVVLTLLFSILLPRHFPSHHVSSAASSHVVGGYIYTPSSTHKYPTCHFALSFSHLSSLQKLLLTRPQHYNHISCFYSLRVIHAPSLSLYLQNIFLDWIGWPLRPTLFVRIITHCTPSNDTNKP